MTRSHTMGKETSSPGLRQVSVSRFLYGQKGMRRMKQRLYNVNVKGGGDFSVVTKGD